MGKVASHDLEILVMVMTIATKMMMMVMMEMMMMMVTAEWVMVGLSEELLSEYYSARLPCLLLTHNTCNHYYSIVIIKVSGILVKDI